MARDWNDPDFDANPEWTEDDFVRAKPADEVHGPEILRQLVRQPGRPRLSPALRKERVTIRLSPEVLEHFRSGGPGWQTRVDEVLRRALPKT